jgi:tetratricopeptide (TPR) repeat protein
MMRKPVTRRLWKILICNVIFGSSTLWSRSDVQLQLEHAEQLEQQSQFAKVVEEVPQLINSNRLTDAELGQALLVLGFAYQEMGEFTQARRAYERALSILSDHQAPPGAYAAALASLAELYQDMGTVKIAIRIDRRALAIYERTQLHGSVARSCVNLAGLELSDGHRRAGRKYLARAIEEAKYVLHLLNYHRASATMAFQ